MMLVEASITRNILRQQLGMYWWTGCFVHTTDCVCSNVKIMLSTIYDEMDVMSFLFCISYYSFNDYSGIIQNIS